MQDQTGPNRPPPASRFPSRPKTYPDGVIGRKLSDDERYDLIEYLKTL